MPHRIQHEKMPPLLLHFFPSLNLSGKQVTAYKYALPLPWQLFKETKAKGKFPPMNFQAWEVFIGQMSINDEGDGKSRASWWCQWVVGKCVGSRMDIISC